MDNLEIKDLLQKNVCEIVFTKVDGTDRTMRCTLLEQYLPQSTSNETSTKKSNPNTMVVWDVDSRGWRSFRTASLKTIQPTKIS